MLKELDRHTGTRENIWFTLEEHERMLEGMRLIHETNKSNFIRLAVANFVETIKVEQKEGIEREYKKRG